MQTKRKKSINISARARKYLSSKIDLSRIFSKLSKKYKGQGGGHKTAANIKINLENKQYLNLKEELLCEIKTSLKKKFKIID